MNFLLVRDRVERTILGEVVTFKSIASATLLRSVFANFAYFNFPLPPLAAFGEAD